MNNPSVETFTPEQSEMVESLKGLLSIPSVKGPALPGAPFGAETLRALHFIQDVAARSGFKTCDLDGYAGTIEFGEGDKEIAMLCHLDVVPAGEGWTCDPFVPFIEDGKLIARGTNDNKGPAMACLYAMKSLKDNGYQPPCRIRLILGLDEESGMQCMVHYKASQALPDAGFTPDSKFPVVFAEKGILHITLKGRLPDVFSSSAPLILVSAKGGERVNMVPATCTLSWIDNPVLQQGAGPDGCKPETLVVHGIPGHASMPEFAENAISKAMGQMGDLLRAHQASHPFVDFYNRTIGTETDGTSLGIRYSDKDSGPLTCNVGLLDMTPGYVSMTLDIRYSVTASSDWICSQIKEKCAAIGLDIVDIHHTPPLFIDKDSAFIQTLLKIYNEATKSSAQPRAIGGGTYARTMPNVVAFGPTFSDQDDVAHQASEYIKLKDLFLCHEIYQKAIVALADLVTK